MIVMATAGAAVRVSAAGAAARVSAAGAAAGVPVAAAAVSVSAAGAAAGVPVAGAAARVSTKDTSARAPAAARSSRTAASPTPSGGSYPSQATTATGSLVRAVIARYNWRAWNAGARRSTLPRPLSKFATVVSTPGMTIATWVAWARSPTTSTARPSPRVSYSRNCRPSTAVNGRLAQATGAACGSAATTGPVNGNVAATSDRTTRRYMTP